MKISALHPWPHSIEDAKSLQVQLQDSVIKFNQLGEIRYVAGIDIGFENAATITRAAVAILSFPDLQLVEKKVVRDKTCFPYVPGYLSFREIPPALKAFEKLRHTPDLLLCDGQGLAHPRRFGLACHLGLWTQLPSIGVAKSRLIGIHKDVGALKGDWQPLYDDDEEIGAVLRTRDNVAPLYVSIGHKIDLPTAIEFTLRCTTKYRLPETTRWAHKLASG